MVGVQAPPPGTTEAKAADASATQVPAVEVPASPSDVAAAAAAAAAPKTVAEQAAERTTEAAKERAAKETAATEAGIKALKKKADAKAAADREAEEKERKRLKRDLELARLRGEVPASPSNVHVPFSRRPDAERIPPECHWRPVPEQMPRPQQGQFNDKLLPYPPPPQFMKDFVVDQHVNPKGLAPTAVLAASDALCEPTRWMMSGGLVCHRVAIYKLSKAITNHLCSLDANATATEQNTVTEKAKEAPAAAGTTKDVHPTVVWAQEKSAKEKKATEEIIE